MADASNYGFPALQLPGIGKTPEPPIRDTQTFGAIWYASEDHWPKASSEYVFLAAAFKEVGRALCPEEWTGEETLPAHLPVFDAVRKATTQRHSFAPPPIWGLDPPPSSQNSARRRYTLEDLARAKAKFEADCNAKWIAAKPEIDAEAATIARMLERRKKVAHWIAQKARDGELATFGMWTGGRLDLWPLRPSVWNGKSDWELFAKCEANVQAPSTQFPCNYFLFFTRESLTRALPAPLVTLKAERDAEQWLRQQFQNPLTASTAKPAFRKEAMRLFPSLSGDGFDRAWAKVTADFPNRAHAGRKRKTL